LPQRNEMGVIDKNFLKDYFTLLGSSRIEAVPTPHRLLGLGVDSDGVGGYIKATSPLRRYIDMVTHFQVERVVSNLLSKLPANHNLPFSEQYLVQELPGVLSRERKIREFQQNAEKFWVWKLIRWGNLESKVVPGREDLMPNRYTIELTSKNEYPLPNMGRLVEFGAPIKFWFRNPDDWEAASWGSIGEAVVDDGLNSRISVNMRWNKLLKSR